MDRSDETPSRKGEEGTRQGKRSARLVEVVPMESRGSRRLGRGGERRGEARIGRRARKTRRGQWISFIMDAEALIQRLFGPRAEKKNTGGRKKEKRRLGRSTLDGVQVYKRVGIVDGGTLGERNEDKKRGQGSKDRTVGYSEGASATQF